MEISGDSMDNDWDSFWKRKDVFSKIVDFGRDIYNISFSSLLEKHSDKNTKLIEIGCGSSTTSLKILKKITLYIGLDISHEALKISKMNEKSVNIKNAFFVCGDCFKLPFKDNTFDLVWSQGLIEHFTNPKEIIKEHLRVCKRNGKVLISVPYKYSYIFLWWYFTRLKFLSFLWLWPDQEFYTKKKLKKLVKVIGINNYIFILYYILGVIILKINKD